MVHGTTTEKPNFAVLYKTVPSTDVQFSFFDFIRVFVFGDVAHLLNFSPVGRGRDLSSDLDSDLNEFKDKEKFTGDSVKIAMLVQSLRRFPYVVSLPAIISLAVIIASFVKLSIPFIRRISVIAPFLASPTTRFKREAIENVTSVPERLEQMGTILYQALEGVEYFAWQDQQQGYSIPSKRSTKFLNYDERRSRIFISEVNDVGDMLIDWLKAFVDTLPSIGKCAGQAVGCHIRKMYWGSFCSGFSLLASCINLAGNAVETVAESFTTFSG